MKKHTLVNPGMDDILDPETSTGECSRAAARICHEFDQAQSPELPTEDIQLRAAHKVRMMVIGDLTEGGKSIPADPKQIKVLLAAADGVDRQAFGRQRAKNDQQMVNTFAEAKSMAAEILKDRADIIAQLQSGSSSESIIDAFTLPDDFEPVPGQTEINPAQETFEEFKVRLKMR